MKMKCGVVLLAAAFFAVQSAVGETPSRGLKVAVARDAPPAVRGAAEELLAATKRHPLLSVLAGGRPPAALADSQALLAGRAADRAYDHLVLVGLNDDPLIQAAWQREARVKDGEWYVFGFGQFVGELGYVESDRNPFLHGAAIDKAPYETEIITLTGSTPAGVAMAVKAFLEAGLVNGVVAAPGWSRPRRALLERDPLPPGFQPPQLAPERAGTMQRIGVTQAAEDEYRGVLEDSGVRPKSIWRWKYYRPGAWDGAGQASAEQNYLAGLHRRAFGNTLWAAEFASTREAGQAAAKIAAAARLERQGDGWQGVQPPSGYGKPSGDPLTLWQRGEWVLMSTLPGEATAELRRGK